MSLNFSRRSFFRFVAMAILSVACVAMLTACQDPNNPVVTGTGSLTVANTVVELTEINGTKDTKVTPAGTGLTASFTIKNGADNPISIYPINFAVKVTDSDGNVTEYNYATAKAVSITGSTSSLAKNKTASVVLTLEGVEIADTDTVTIVYTPRINYTEITGSWTFAPETSE